MRYHQPHPDPVKSPDMSWRYALFTAEPRKDHVDGCVHDDTNLCDARHPRDVYDTTVIDDVTPDHNLSITGMWFMFP